MADNIALVYVLLDELMEDEDDEVEDIPAIQSIVREDRVKCVNYFERTVPGYLPDTFARFFKVSKETMEFLCELLSHCPNLQERKYPGGREPIPLEKKVLMTLRFLASQDTLHDLSDRFGVTESAFINSKRAVVSSLNTLIKHFIKWPSSDQLRSISNSFNGTGARPFPGVVGAIDGSHIPIEAPLLNPQSYYNRKKFHSVILQAVASHDLMFTDINVGWPGRVHDAKVLSCSELYRCGFQKCGQGEFHLLGDAAYPVKEWLLTPYRDTGNLTSAQKRFNTSLSSKRQVIERAFGLLKGRFRRLKYINMKSVEEICETIACACVLHNICIMEKDGADIEDVVPVEEEEESAVIVPLLQNDVRGNVKRVRITNQLQ